MKQTRFWLMLFSALLVFGSMLAGASENIPIAIAHQGQFAPRGVSDGIGGTVVIWEDFRTGKDWDVYAQRLNPDGIPYGIRVVWRFAKKNGINDGCGWCVMTHR